MSKRHSEDYHKSGSTKTHNETTEYSRQHDSKKQRTSDKYDSDGGRSDKSNKTTESGHSKSEKTSLRPLSDSKHESSKNAALSSGIQIKLGAPKSAKETKPKLAVASIFNQESDDEPEEMPPEAKMRMRNIGRETPTSAGPNSFGKTKQGFCHAKKVFEKSLEKALDDLNDK